MTTLSEITDICNIITRSCADGNVHIKMNLFGNGYTYSINVKKVARQDFDVITLDIIVDNSTINNNVYLINKLSSNYYIEFNTQPLYLLSSDKINSNNNVFHTNMLEILFRYGARQDDRSLYRKVFENFFSNENNLQLGVIGGVISCYYKSGSYMVETTNINLMQIVFDILAKYDIPYSRELICRTIKVKVEVPHIHRYGYDMNDLDFMYLYKKHDFIPQTYDIDIEKLNRYRSL